MEDQRHEDSHPPSSEMVDSNSTRPTHNDSKKRTGRG